MSDIHTISMWLSTTVPREMSVSLCCRPWVPHVPHPPQPKVILGTEHTVLQEQRYHLHVLALTAFIRQAKDYTETKGRTASSPRAEQGGAQGKYKTMVMVRG